jgi:phenylacetate-coenzyme A ligase PaaK-like adenylate-forming protein
MNKAVRARRQALLAHAREHSPLYRTRLRPDMPWEEIAPGHKRELMARFDEWVTDRAVTLDGVRAFVSDPRRAGVDYLGRYAVWSSSGTTGEPGLFVHDGYALSVYAMLSALRMDREHWLDNLRGVWTGGGRSVLIAALDGHYAGVSFWRRQCRTNLWLAGRARTLSVLLPGSALCAELDTIAPAFVASYPSVLAELARAQVEGRLAIAPVALWAGGETMTPSTREYIGRAFGAHVVNDYGASECLSMAFECVEGRLHLNDDWALLEPVDQDYRPVPPGTPSHSVLLTNLANRVQPMIRYELGDSVTFLPDPCPCGNPRPTLRVEGRCDDTLHLRTAAQRVVHLSPMALSTVLEEQAGVHRFQLRQTAACTLELRVDAAHEASAQQVLKGFLLGQGLGNVRVQMSSKQMTCEPRSGKLRQVICALRMQQMN